MATAPYNYSYIFKYIIIGKWAAMPVSVEGLQQAMLMNLRVQFTVYWYIPLLKAGPPESIFCILYAILYTERVQHISKCLL